VCDATWRAMLMVSFSMVVLDMRGVLTERGWQKDGELL
jgi:hypothetical protein